MKDYYAFDDIEVDEESDRQRKIRKIYRYVIGAFLLLLMLGFLIPQTLVGSLIEGKKLKDDQLQSNGKSILFSPGVYENLREFYIKNQLTEVSLCLTGTVNGDQYIVDNFYQPKTFFQTPISVRSELCNQVTIITMHTHPFKNCLFSRQDISSYRNYVRRNPNAITSVMCDIDRFAFFGI